MSLEEASAATIIYSAEARTYMRPRTAADLEADGVTKKKRRAETLAWIMDNGGLDATLLALVHPTGSQASARDRPAPEDIHAALLLEDEAARRRCEASAERLWNGMASAEGEDLEHRIALLGVFPHRSDWAEAVARAAIQTKSLRRARDLLIATLTDRALLVEVVREQGVTSAIVNLVPALGESAAPILGELLEIARYPNEEKSVVRGLACIGSVIAAEIFAKNLRRKNITPYAAELFARFPHLAEAALGDLAKKKTQTGDIARTILTSVARAREAATDAEVNREADRAGNADGARDGERDRDRDHDPDREECNDDAIPRILREPPWLGLDIVPAAARKKRAPAIPNLKVPKEPLRLHWSEPARHRWIADRFEGLGVLRTEEQVEKLRRELAIERGTTYLYANYPADIILPLLADPPKGLRVWHATPPQVLALYGEAALAIVVDRHADNLRDVRMYIESPQIAASLASELRTPTNRNAALRWIERFPEAAARGLIVVALGGESRGKSGSGDSNNAAPKKKDDKSYLGAELGLRHLAHRGHAALIERAAVSIAKEYLAGVDPAPDVVERVKTIIAIRGREGPTQAPKMPSSYRPSELRAPRLRNGKRLPRRAIEVLDQLLCAAPNDRAFHGFDEIRAACDARSLAEHAWDLAKAWDINGGKASENWMLYAVANVGDDEVVRRLTPALRSPGIATMLGEIGTDAALMELITILMRLRDKRSGQRGTKTRASSARQPNDAWATQAVERIAAFRGIDIEELVDHFVPTCNVDKDGGIALDLGARTYRITFDPQLARVLWDENGSRVNALPRGGAGSKDDPEKLKAAATTLTDLEEDMSAIADLRASSLERAMITGRAWTREDFDAVWVKHPLMRHMARGVVWELRGERGGERVLDAQRQPRTFRIAEDGSFADLEDVQITALLTASQVGDGDGDEKSATTVGVAHPALLSIEERTRWRAMFADYKLLQPFDQLGRQPARFPESRHDQSAIAISDSDALKSIDMNALELHLEKAGWQGWHGLKQRPSSLVLAFANNVYGVLSMSAHNILLYPVKDGRPCTIGALDAIPQCELYRVFEILGAPEK